MSKVELGQGVSVCSYSDVEPYEVVKISKTGKKITLRAMNYKQINKENLEFNVGGFAANCSNQRKQEWEITSNTEGATITANWSEKKKMYTTGYGRVDLASARRFYDFNF